MAYHQIILRKFRWEYACGSLLLLLILIWHFQLRIGREAEDVLDWKSSFSGRLDQSPRHTVDLSENGLSSLPDGFVKWAKGKVHTLYLSGNEFDEIPDLSELDGLKMLSLRRNSLRHVDCDRLPESIYHLILTDNIIEGFTGDCKKKLRKLNKLMMARNQLKVFPEGLILPDIELIRLPQNRLVKLPVNLLKTSPRLKWATFAENPCCPEPKLDLPDLGQVECTSDRALGGGTSGTALFCANTKTVFKKFKSLSSDGSADAEMRIMSLLPKNHPNVLAPLGIGHLGDDAMSKGVMFPYKNALPAGLPPFFGSDDRFPPEKQKRFDASRIYEASIQLTCALADIHDAGVVHMDLYAHNTLLSESEAVILDFGAATCTKFLNEQETSLLRLLDHRALIRLMEDLNIYVSKDNKNSAKRFMEKLLADARQTFSPRELCQRVSK